ncbi:MAG: hypothetical protein AAGG99_02240 [Pseudomonadota bacterium]
MPLAGSAKPVAVDNIIAFPACEAVALDARPTPILTGHDVERIDIIRANIQAAQVAARCDVDRACALLAVEPSQSIAAFTSALFGLFTEFSVQPMTFHHPGAREFSDSEVWLSRLLRSVQHSQGAQARALIAWRIKPMGHRRALFLAGGLVAAFAETPHFTEDW